MKKEVVLLASLVFVATAGRAQNGRTVVQQPVNWTGYINSLRLAPKWTLSSEAQIRFFLEPVAQHLWAVRFRAYRNLGRGWDVAPGVARFVNLRNTPEAVALPVPELRSMAELNQRQSFGRRWLVHHRYLAEARFFRKTANGALAAGHNFNWRFRYRLGLDFDVWRGKKRLDPLKIRLFDELMVNAGKNVGSSFFDQNRMFAGLQIPLAHDLNLEAGYLRMFQQQRGSENFFDRHIWRLTFLHRVDVAGRTD